MVERQLRRRGIEDERVLAAMAEVPRERFVPEDLRRRAYRDGAPEADVLVRSTQAEIAHLAGTSRESASRFLATLERAGIVTLGRGKVTVHDPARLRNYIH